MGDKNVHQGGCDITWKIEKCNFFKNVYKSPTFYLSYSQKTEWYLEISCRDSCYFCYLKPMEIIVKTTLHFDVCIYGDENSVEKCGILTLPDESHLQLAYIPLQEKVLLGSLLVHARLKDISDSTCSLHCLFFRSVEVVQTGKVNYEIPFYEVWMANLDLVVRVLPVFPSPIPSKMKIGGDYEKDTDVDKILIIDIIESSTIERFGLSCKIICEDPSGRSIGSATQFHVFDKTSGNACSLKIRFDEPTLRSFYSPKYVLSLKCEFSTIEGNSISWIEKSVVLPGTNENISDKISENEKDSFSDDFLNFYLEGKHTDIVISAQGRKFQAHKTVLKARSPVFAAMFDADMVEKESNMVNIADMEAETLDQMLFFMYSKTLQTEEYGIILNVYEAADKYQIFSLKQKCSEILRRNMNTQNALELLTLADMHHDANFQNSIETFIFANAKTILHSEEWKALIEYDPSLGCKVMYKFCMTNM